MSGETVSGAPGRGSPASVGDSSVGAMDGVIASIRQAMRESAPAATDTPPTARGGDGVLRLDPSMLVQEAAVSPPGTSSADASSNRPEPVAQTQPPLAAPPAAGLVSREAEGAAKASLAELARASQASGSAAAAGGLTVEALVRDALQPLLSGWLEANLPGMVERIVRTEIERILDRR